MGCSIHLWLEIRPTEERKHIIIPGRETSSGKVLQKEVCWAEKKEWSTPEISRKEWSVDSSAMLYKLTGLKRGPLWWWAMPLNEEEHGAKTVYDTEPLELRGFPDDASGPVLNAYASTIVVETKEEAERINSESPQKRYAETIDDALEYSKKTGCKIYDYYGEKRIKDRDWHNESWCTTQEMEQCINDAYANEDKYTYDKTYIEYKSLLGAMKGLESGGLFECRAVFWFDN